MTTKLLMSAAAIAMLMAGGVASAQNPDAGSSGGAAGSSSGMSGGASAGSGGTSAPSVRGGAEGGASGAVESPNAQKGMRAREENAPTREHPRSAQENKAGPGSHMNRNSASDSKSGAEGRTTGNAATSAKGAPPAAKRSQITSAIKQEKVTAVTNVNFNVAVGTRVPASVHFYPVPASVIAIYPEWRGYEFILVEGRYVIVEPETHEIVYILT